MSTFNPPKLISGRHLQSIIGSLKIRRPWVEARAHALLQQSTRQLIDCGHGVRLEAHYSPQPEQPDNAPLIIMIHGWHGSHQSLYLLSSAAKLYHQGFNILRLNLRDHGDTHHLNKEFFHSCRIEEVVGAVHAVQQRFQTDRLALVGFSLGGNFALRVALHSVDAGIHLKQVVTVCPVLDPKVSLIALDNGFIGYQKYFLKGWRQTLEQKKNCFPEEYDIKDAYLCKNLTQLTDFFVRSFTDYPDMDQYLNGYSIADQTLKPLTVPCTLIAALDDPVIPSSDLSRLARPASLAIKPIPKGGHCGFIENFTLESWVDQCIVQQLAPILT